MRSILFYNPAVLAAEEGAANVTLDDIRATAKALSQRGKPCIIIDASKFTGNLERDGDEYPSAVHLLGDDDPITDDEDGPTVFGAIRQAFEAVEVPVAEVDVLEPEAPSEDASPSDDADELASLKARATELGIHFASNIGIDTLRGRVEKAEAEKAGE